MGFGVLTIMSKYEVWVCITDNYLKIISYYKDIFFIIKKQVFFKAPLPRDNFDFYIHRDFRLTHRFTQMPVNSLKPSETSTKKAVLLPLALAS